MDLKIYFTKHILITYIFTSIKSYFSQGFDELLQLAEKGDHRHADMLVRDIYGGDYKTLGLPGDLIASSFGKVCLKRGNGKYFKQKLKFGI